MKLAVQRVNIAGVSVKAENIGQIGQGLLLLVGFKKGDTSKILQKMAEKVANLRIFSNGREKMNLSILDVGGSILVVPQFTLYADLKGQNRPFFGEAEEPQKAQILFEQFCDDLQDAGIKQVKKGEFGAYMQVSLVNDGPVTIILDSDVV